MAWTTLFQKNIQAFLHRCKKVLLSFTGKRNKHLRLYFIFTAIQIILPIVYDLVPEERRSIIEAIRHLVCIRTYGGLTIQTHARVEAGEALVPKLGDSLEVSAHRSL